MVTEQVIETVNKFADTIHHLAFQGKIFKKFINLIEIVVEDKEEMDEDLTYTTKHKVIIF